MTTKGRRVALYLCKEEEQHFDTINAQLNERYGLRLDRAIAMRIALQTYCRNVIQAVEPYEIFNFTDLENALSGIGKKKAGTSKNR